MFLGRAFPLSTELNNDGVPYTFMRERALLAIGDYFSGEEAGRIEGAVLSAHEGVRKLMNSLTN